MVVLLLRTVVGRQVRRIRQLHAAGRRRFFALPRPRARRLVEQEPVHVHVFGGRRLGRGLFLGAPARQQAVEKTFFAPRHVLHGDLVHGRVQVARPDRRGGGSDVSRRRVGDRCEDRHLGREDRVVCRRGGDGGGGGGCGGVGSGGGGDGGRGFSVRGGGGGADGGAYSGLEENLTVARIQQIQNRIDQN
ncbi:hypothetical protein AGLY_005264, partial [Aphis glycines]